MKENESTYIQQAQRELNSVRGKRLEQYEREKLAIDLTAKMLVESTRTRTRQEKIQQEELARMMRDPQGKAFTMMMTDECFRSSRSPRAANQLIYLLENFGIPEYLSSTKALQLAFFKEMGSPFLSYFLIPLVKRSLRKAFAKVILPGEKQPLHRHLISRKKEGVNLNLNHLGEAILGEKESHKRLSTYIDDLANPEIDYISIKISTIYSQINLLGWEKTLEILSERLRKLYRAAMANPILRLDGSKGAKFVNLDMEEYRDLHLTKELFQNVLSEPEFIHYSAGIVLQAYLPDAFDIQKELTQWAITRVEAGGAPIKIRIVKGANLAMEQFEASVQGWPQAPYKLKKDVDANYKRMVDYGCNKAYANAVHLGVATHNLFDVAFAMLLRLENEIEKEITFEMLEGMADNTRRVVQKLANGMLLYCPVATNHDFQSAVGYLVRRLDENTGPENFLRHSFGLKPNTIEWNEQVAKFNLACQEMNNVSSSPRRIQNRLLPPEPLSLTAPFHNEADTDFSLKVNRQWAKETVQEWKNKSISPIPLVINGKSLVESASSSNGVDPSHPNNAYYSYLLADWNQIDESLNAAKANEASWAATSISHRCQLLAASAQKMRERRNDFMGVMMADGGKTILESDTEISEAIDFAEYYLRMMQEMDACKDTTWRPKGTVLVAPPWNFPISIPAGGILAAIITGNCVLFKPAPESVLSGWTLVNALWDAGIPKTILQFINCEDEPIGSRLIKDPRLNCVCLTGATSTAKHFLKLRPGLDLMAETGGKNAMIITGLADRDLAIKDLIQSAFGHAGQKCSATSLAILEAEVYDDRNFRAQLKDAVESMRMGSAWDLSAKITPLIRPPGELLLRALTSLDAGEEWLVKPKQSSENPCLWSPGVKLGVQEDSFSHQTEFFGPVLSLMRAKNLEHAIELANSTPYGLTAGLHSLDVREQARWLDSIIAGNCYINRRMTGAIVRRQPFGGTKASCFGNGAKAGGPNYLIQFMHAQEVHLAQQKAPIGEQINNLSRLLSQFEFTPEQLGSWYASVSNYAFWGKRFEMDDDPSKILGQDNLFRYRPRKNIVFRIQKEDKALDILRVIAAALTCNASLEISWSRSSSSIKITDEWKETPTLLFLEESEDIFHHRVKNGGVARVRLLSEPSLSLQKAASLSACYLDYAPVLANGRFELLHYLREISISIDYHRYGNLGMREGETRSPLL